MVEQLTELHKIIDDLENIKVYNKDDDKVLPLLSSLPIFFEHFKDFLYHVRDVLLFGRSIGGCKNKKKSKDEIYED